MAVYAVVIILTMRASSSVNPVLMKAADLGVHAACAALLVFTVMSTREVLDNYAAGSWTEVYVDVVKKRTNKGDRVLFLSTSVDPAYPTLILSDRRPGSRYLCLLPIPLIYNSGRDPMHETFRYHKPGNRPPEETRFLEELGHDVLTNRPKLIFIDARLTCQACPPGFNIPEYLEVSGWKAEYMSNYRMIGYIARVPIPCAVYERTP